MPAMISVRPKSLGVKTAATPSSLSRARVASRDDPADDHRHVARGPASRSPSSTAGHQLHVRAGQDREPDAVHVLGHGGGDDLLGRQPDALVDHLEAGVAGPDRDLLGAVGVAVEAGLADQQPQPAAELLAGRRDLARGPRPARRRPRRRRRRRRRRSGARNSPNTSRSVPAHSPVVAPARAAARVAAIRLASVLASAASRGQRLGDLGLVALRPSTASTAASADRSASGSAAWIAASRSAVSGDGSVVS